MWNPGSWHTPSPPTTPSRPAADLDAGASLAEALRRSELPTGLLGGGGSEVEARLAQDAGDLLLRHLACEGGADDLDEAFGDLPRDDGCRQRTADDGEIQELLQFLDQHPDPAAPPLDTAVTAERAHVLADLAATADGHARQAACRRLSDLIGDPAALEGIGAVQLGELVQGIASLPGDGPGANVLLQVLRMAALRTLDHAEEQADQPVSPQSAMGGYAS